MTEHNSIESLLQEADNLLAGGDWEGARELYRQAVGLEPNDIAIRERVLEAAKQALDFQVIIGQDMALAELFVAGDEADKAIDSYKDILNLEKFAQNSGIHGSQLSDIQNLVAQVKPEIFAMSSLGNVT